MPIRRPARLTAATGLGVGAFVIAFGVAPAWAHLEPTLSAIPAGETTTVGFTVEHGCDESPTTSLAFQIPDGLDAASAVAKPGWNGERSGDVITFTADPGHEQPAHEATVFHLDLNPSPDAVGETLLLKAVQTCEEGEIRWIEEWDGQGEEPEHPAPAIEIEARGEEPVTPEPEGPGGGGDEGTGGGDHGGGEVTTTIAGGTGGGDHHGGSSDDQADDGHGGAGVTTTTVLASPTTTEVAVAGEEAAATSLSGSAATDDTSAALVVLVVAALGFAGVAIYRHRKAS